MQNSEPCVASTGAFYSFVLRYHDFGSDRFLLKSILLIHSNRYRVG